MYRLCDRYHIIFCDIDDTLIHGVMTDLMNATWNLFHSELIARLLMKLQAKFKLYELNTNLFHSLGRGLCKDCRIVFLTARVACRDNYLLLTDIMENPFSFNITALGTDNPAEDKITYIKNYIETVGLQPEDVCIVDDDLGTCMRAENNGIDSYNPKWYIND